MEQTQKPSKRLLWVGIAVVVVIVLVVAVAVYTLLGTSKQEAVSPSPSPTVQAVATKDEVNQNLATLDGSLKQAAVDQAAAKAALKDGTNQIKVGS